MQQRNEAAISGGLVAQEMKIKEEYQEQQVRRCNINICLKKFFNSWVTHECSQLQECQPEIVSSKNRKIKKLWLRSYIVAIELMKLRKHRSLDACAQQHENQ